jgi:hypothetical protein
VANGETRCEEESLSEAVRKLFRAPLSPRREGVGVRGAWWLARKTCRHQNLDGNMMGKSEDHSD